MVSPGGGGQSDSESEVSEAESGAGGGTLTTWDSDSEGLEGQGWSSFLGGASPLPVQAAAEGAEEEVEILQEDITVQVLRRVAGTPDVIELGEDEEVEMEEQPLIPPGTEELEEELIPRPPGTEDELEEEQEDPPPLLDPPPPGEEGGDDINISIISAGGRAAIAEFQLQLGMEGAARREENWRPSPLPPRRRLPGGGGLEDGGERPQLVSPVNQGRGLITEGLEGVAGPPVAR